jgi:hypothetical protein
MLQRYTIFMLTADWTHASEVRKMFGTIHEYA